MTATAAEFKFFDERKREREKKYGMTKLQLVGDDEAQPKDKTLAQKSQEHDEAMFKSRGFKTTYGHTVWKTGPGEDDFKPMRLWLDISYR